MPTVLGDTSPHQGEPRCQPYLGTHPRIQASLDANRTWGPNPASRRASTPRSSTKAPLDATIKHQGEPRRESRRASMPTELGDLPIPASRRASTPRTSTEASEPRRASRRASMPTALGDTSPHQGEPRRHEPAPRRASLDAHQGEPRCLPHLGTQPRIKASLDANRTRGHIPG